MYEKYTKQALPEKKYRELLGTALCVFNSNNSFIIENILRSNDNDYNWYKLIDEESGKVENVLKQAISNEEINNLFSTVVKMRNRIVHSFQVTNNNCQILATKEKHTNKQFIITEKYLMDFIKKNEKLSIMLHNFRGH